MSLRDPQPGVVELEEIQKSNVSLLHNLQLNVVYNFGRGKFIFAHPVYFQGIRVKFVGLYERHRVKVKVTGAKWSTIQIPAM